MVNAVRRLPLASRLIVPVVIATLAISLAAFAWILRGSRLEATREATERARAVGVLCAEQVNDLIDRSFAVPRTLAAALEGAQLAGGIDRREATAMIERALAETPQALALYTAWEPGAFDGRDAEFAGTAGHDATGRFVPYWNRGDGTLRLEPLVDYEVPGNGDYYLLPRATRRDAWIEPYLYPVGGREVLMTSLVAPIEADGKFVGIVGLDLDLVTLTEVVGSIRPYDGAGRAMLVSAEGRIVAHPDPSRIGGRLADEDGSVARLMRGAGADGISVGTGRTDFIEGPARLVSVPVTAHGIGRPWQLVVGVPERTIDGGASAETLRLTASGIGLASLLALVLWWTARRIAAELLEVSDRLHDGSRDTVSAVAQIAQEGSALSDGAQEQAAAIEETGASLREIASQTSANRHTAEASSTLAAAARGEAEAGAAEMERMKASLVASCHAADGVSAVIKTIDEIAFQTNLLALNAAVEAARAGEHGAGFAVVADEVRNLARRCAAATRSSDELIERSRGASREAESLGGIVGERFDRIHSRNRELDALLGELVAATMRQEEGLRSITTAIGQIGDVTTANAASAVETAAASAQLSAQAGAASDLAGRLVELVGGTRRTRSGRGA